MGIETYDIRRPEVYAILLEEGGDWQGVAMVESSIADKVIYSITASNDDTGAHVLSVHVTGNKRYSLACVSIPAGSGFAGVAPVDVMLAFPVNLQQRIVCARGQTLSFSLDAEPTAGKKVVLVGLGGEI